MSTTMSRNKSSLFSSGRPVKAGSYPFYFLFQTAHQQTERAARELWFWDRAGFPKFTFPGTAAVIVSGMVKI